MKDGFSVKRKIIQFIAFALSNPHVGNFGAGKLYKGPWKQFCNPGINCYSCPAASLSCPIGSLQAVNGSIDFKWSFYVVGTLCALGILLGRAVCGFLCPFGLLQELIYKIPFPKRKLPDWMKYIKYIMLFIVVLTLPVVITNAMGMGDPFFCKYICPAGTLEGGLPLLIARPEMRSMAGTRFALKIAILVITIIGCLVTARFFCKVLCPLGAFYGFFNKVSLVRLETDSSACVSCGKCSSVCPMDVDPVRNPNSMECIRCGRCVSACNVKAINYVKPSLISRQKTDGNAQAKVNELYRNFKE